MTSKISTALPPTGLLCDLLAYPERTRVANPHPRFGWIVRDTGPDAHATAYRILVASSPALLRAAAGDLWDTGKVTDDRDAQGFANSLHVRYGGRRLHSDTTYHWQVRTWNRNDEASPWSKPQAFQTGRLKRTHQTAGYPLEQHVETPSELATLAPGHTFIDFGRAAFGTLDLTLTCAVAGAVDVHLGEVRRDACSLDREPPGSQRYKVVTLPVRKGTGTYRVALPPDTRNTGPRAVPIPDHIGPIMPFRYAEVVGAYRRLRTTEVRRIMVHYPFHPEAARFTSSDPVLNDVWELCHHTMRATSFAGLYVDGDRERIPYEADAYINQLGHYACDREFTLARRTHEYLVAHPTYPTEWLMFSVLLAWADYEQTGDASSMDCFYEDLQAKTMVQIARSDGLISVTDHPPTPELLDAVHMPAELRTLVQDIVDWPVVERDGYEMVPVKTVVNALHYRALSLMARIAAVLGRGRDAGRYRRRADRLRSAIVTRMVDSVRGLFVDGLGSRHCSLHANMFPLAFGLVPESLLPTVLSFIREKGMACSVYGAQFLLDGLYRAGEANYALSLMTSRTERSWAHMIYDVGSTMALEAWDNRFKPNQDWNHAWGAAPANIIPRRLMGVRPLEPGFSRILVHPQPGSLAYAEMTVPTIRGPVEVRIENEPGHSFRLEVDIPANTTARVVLPAVGGADTRVDVDGGCVQATACCGHLVIDPVGSGRHAFCLNSAVMPPRSRADAS